MSLLLDTLSFLGYYILIFGYVDFLVGHYYSDSEYISASLIRKTLRTSL